MILMLFYVTYNKILPILRKKSHGMSSKSLNQKYKIEGVRNILLPINNYLKYNNQQWVSHLHLSSVQYYLPF